MKQHFLPIVYLKEFLNDNGKLHCLDVSIRKYGRQVFDEPKYPAEVCRSKDFYTIKPTARVRFPHMANLSSLHLENSFHTYERDYTKIIAKIKSSQSALILKDAESLIYTIVDLKIRNNYFREKVVPKAHQNIIEDDLNNLKKQIEEMQKVNFSHIPKEEFLRVVDKVQRDFEPSEENHAQSHLSSMSLRRNRNDEVHLKIISHLMKFEWLILKSKNKFITTDNPGFSLDMNNKVHNTKFDADFIFFFPLTPSLCLSINPSIVDLRYQQIRGQKAIKYVEADNQFINSINDRHGFHFTRYVFSNNSNLINEMAAKINSSHID